MENDPDSGRRAAIHTLGCRLNQTESAILHELLAEAGYRVEERAVDADLVVVHTCCVTREAQAKSRQQLRKLIQRNPNARVVALGCYAQLRPEELEEIAGVDVVVGNDGKLDLARWLETQPQSGRDLAPSGNFTVPFARGHAPIARRMNLKIQEGCDNKCSYCVVWRARGHARSRAFGNLLDEAENLLERGARELVLTGVNIGTYRDGARGLTEVVDGLAALGVERIRISSIELGTIQEELLDRMAANNHPLLPFLHIPLQSGSDRILAAMRRRYSREDYMRYLEYAARRVENIGLGCDIMVGFPGETGADFEASANLLSASPLSYAHVFKYSEHKDAPSARIPDKVPPPVAQERSRNLMALSDTKYESFLRSQIGRTVEVLFEQLEDGLWTGYAGNYARIGVCSPQNLKNLIEPILVHEATGGLAKGAFEHDA